MNSSGGRECRKRREKEKEIMTGKKEGFVKEGGRENKANPQGMSRSEELENEKVGSKRLKREGKEANLKRGSEKSDKLRPTLVTRVGLVSINPAVPEFIHQN